jgi:hypothetical protein
MSDDRDLRDLFARLRESDRRLAPDCERLLQRARRQSPPRLALAGAGLAVAVMAAALLVMTRLADKPDGDAVTSSIPTSITYWRAPTDFLLDTPGRDLLRTIPGIGLMSTSATTAVPGAAPAAAPPAGMPRSNHPGRRPEKERYS